MDALSPPHSYADSLLFAAEVTEAATLIPNGEHGAERLRRPFLDELKGHKQANWVWCDNVFDFEVAASGPLRATTEYLVVRRSLSMPSADRAPATRWPLLEDRIANLKAALGFAAATSEEAYRIEPDEVVKPWFRHHLDEMLAPPRPGERLRELEERVRQGVLICYRYRKARYELFGDRHWEGRPVTPWWCPHDDLALRSPFDGYVRGDSPSFALRLDATEGQIRGTFAVANRYSNPPSLYPVTATGDTVAVPDELARDPVCGVAVHEALRALGHRVEGPASPPEGASCIHRWRWSRPDGDDARSRRPPGQTTNRAASLIRRIASSASSRVNRPA